MKSSILIIDDQVKLSALLAIMLLIVIKDYFQFEQKFFLLLDYGNEIVKI
jgi:hypothetical protein